MEVEVKLRLLTESDYTSFRHLLRDKTFTTQEQTNYFLDGIDRELQQVRAVVRCRHDAVSGRWRLTLKHRAQLVEGISRVQEEEEEMPAECGNALITDPQTQVAMWANKVPLLKKILETFPVKQWHLFGQFKNHREVYPWRQYQLELDRTTYAFGTAYEIEVETTEPEQCRSELELYLKENGVHYAYSQRNKFVCMLKGGLDEVA